MRPSMVVRKGSEGEEEFHSLSGSEEDNDDRDDVEYDGMDAPSHPVRSMQGAFEESIVESMEENDAPEEIKNAEARRQTLLESDTYDESWRARWRQQPEAKHHPLLKLVSQIVFGMHLLHQQQARSEGEVVKILQTHVNEVDGFLERTSEDFRLAINDIDERIRHLQLPMTHKEVFEVMLDDKKFRTQLIDGNDKIESIIDRTTKATNASMYDIDHGVEATKGLGDYLNMVQDDWPKGKRAIEDVFGAMRGNEQGWARYMQDLQTKADSLKLGLVKLGTVLGEISQLAAAASRRNRKQSNSVSSGPPKSGSKSQPSSPGLRSRFTDEAPPALPSKTNTNKPLPKQPPRPSAFPPQDISRKPFVPFADRYEYPRQSPLSPEWNAPRTSTNRELERPRTAGATTESSRQARAAHARSNISDLPGFLRNGDIYKNAQRNNPHQNPLRSNPPEATSNHGQTDAWSGRSHSINATSGMDERGPMRSKSQGTADMQQVASTRTSAEQKGFAKVSGEQNTTLAGTGFARRLSKRMKHLPNQEEAEGNGNNPHDSAYSSGTDGKSRSRPDSFVSPLPSKSMEASRSSPVNGRQQQQKLPHEMRTLDGQSVRSLAPTSKSRGSTIKNIFSRRWTGAKTSDDWD